MAGCCQTTVGRVCLAALAICLAASPLVAFFPEDDWLVSPVLEREGSSDFEAEPPELLVPPALAGPGILGTRTTPPRGVTLLSTGFPRAAPSVRGLPAGLTLLREGPFRLPSWGFFIPGFPDPVETMFSDTVVIRRQPQTVIHGSGASGGSIGTGTAPAPAIHPEEPLTLTLGTELLSRPRGHTSAFQTVSGEGPYAIQIRGLRRQSASFSHPPHPSGRNDELDDFMVSFGLTTFLPRGGRVSVHGSGADHHFTTSGGGVLPDGALDSQARSGGMELQLPGLGNRFDQASLALGHASHTVQPSGRDNGTPPRASWTLTQLRGSAEGETEEGRRFQVGFEALRERLEFPFAGTPANDVFSDTVGLFWIEEGSASELRWLAGGRLEASEVDNLHLRSRTGVGGALSADLFRDLDHGSTLRAGVGYQNLAPTMDHLLFNSAKPPSHRMTDGRLGWNLRGGRGGLSLLAYGRHFQNSPVVLPETPFSGTPSALVQIGGEATADWIFLKTADGGARWEAWIDQTRALSRDPEAYADANRSLRVFNRIEGDYHLWSAGVDLLHQLRTGRDPSGSGQTVVGLDLSREIRTFRSHWEVSLRWTNLLGASETRSPSWGSPVPPRSLSLTVTATF